MIAPGTVGRADGKQRALMLVTLMILASWLPMGTPLVVSAHSGIVAEWGSEGQNDTGWIQLNATHSGLNSQTASANLLLDFAPGAALDNLTFEIRVNGSEGVWVDQPQILLPDAPASLLDWRGLGTLGQQNNFIGNNPHSGRLSPNSDANAGWILPGGATVTDVVIEALRPADPYVSMQRIEVEVTASDIHPVDGRLFIAIGESLIQLDSHNNPPVIEIFNLEEEIHAFSIDATNQVIFVSSTDEDDGAHLHAFSLSDSGHIGEIDTNGLAFTALADGGLGTLWASDGDGLYSGVYQISAGTPSMAWTRVVDLAVGSGNAANDLLVLSTDVWVATAGSGLYHYDASSGSTQQYGTQNTLPSDIIVDLEMAGTHLLIATADSGIARRDVMTNSWLATWTDGNWLASNNIESVSSVDGWVHILAGDTTHSYNTTSFSFSSSYTMQDLSLPRDLGNALIPWPSGGSRAPSYSSVLVGDGSGIFTILHPHMQGHGANQGVWDQMVLASGPSEDDMQDAVELNGIVYIVAGEKIERFDLTQNRWLNPLTGGNNPYASDLICIVSDGMDIFIGTKDEGLIHIPINGTQVLSQRGPQWTTADGLSSNEVSDMAYESATGQIVAMHPFSGLSVISPNNSTVTQTWTEFNGLNSNAMTALAVRDGIAYAGTINDGIERIDVVNATRLNPWTSTGMDDVDSMPIAIDGNTLYLGMYGYGVIVYDLTTGEQTDTWRRTGGGGGGGSNQIPSNNVRSLAVLSPGTVLVGTDNGGARHTSAGWTNMGSTGNQFADEFYDWDFDNQFIYAATETGVCQWTRSSLQYQQCWDDDPDGLPGEFTQSIELISGNMWVGGVQGAGVIDIANDTVTKAWEAGVVSGNAKVIVIGDVAYLGYDGMGILRYDLTTDEWLSPWDAVNSNLIESNGVTAMVQDTNPNRIWVGGDMGLNLIDVFNETLEEDWDLGNNGGGLQLPNQEPAELAIVGNVLYYLQSRFGNNGFSSNDNIYRYNILTRSQISSIDVGASEGYSALVHGMGVIDDIVHFGISPTQWWQGDGHFVRWNHSSNSWMDGIESEGQVERVNADFAGDCHPTPTNCHLYAAYGNTPLHQVDMNGNLVRSWDETVIEGPIRGIVTWDGAVLFGTEEGVFRYNYSSNTWLTEWTENNGLPNNVENSVFSMEVIGDDLWLATMTTQGWQRNSKILQLNGTSGQWTVHDVGSGQVPEGYGADIGLCDGIVHVAINRWSGWGSQGGVARYDLNSASWLSDWNQGQGGLPHDNPVAITCDEGYDIVYIGFEEDDGSISRYDYVNQQFLATLDEDDNVISEPIFPGAMHHFGGGLLVGHYDSGGITFIGTTGQIVTNVIPFSTDAEATSISPVPGGQAYEFAIGRAGGSSGYNRVDNLDTNGLSLGAWDNLASLSTGRIAEMIGNSTHVWLSPIDDLTSVYGSAILEGERLPNGTIQWTRAWNLQSLVINELFLDGETLWITTAGIGLVSINLTTSAFSFTGAPLHYQMDEMAWYGNELVVGLMGTGGTAAGVQRFDTNNNTWGTGRLAAGLPSNVVLDFERIGDRVYIATLFGIGVWNLTEDDWGDPMTTADGLPTPFITHLDSDNGILIIGTPSGLMSYEPGLGLGQMYGRNQGMVGNAVSGIAKITDASGAITLFVSHNGEGPTRPGFSEVTTTIMQSPGLAYIVQDTTLVDVLPSNRITALASDWWGVHIATDAEPLMHWNATASEMEQGTSSSGLASWPIQHMDSDGQNIIAISSLGVNRIDVTGSFHSSSSLISYAGLNRGTITSNGIYIVGQDGLHVWSGHPSFIEKDRAYMRRAEPLMINFGVGGESLDATDLARPGNKITLINSSNSVTLPLFGNPGPSNILLTQDMLTLTSPVSEAATWVSSSRLNYSGSWDLAALNPGVLASVQAAIDNSALTASGRSLHIQLQSPQNGTIEVRLTYDWVRSESPSELIEIYDRPEDGGGVLVAQWTVTQDHTFYAYRIYLRPGSNWTSPPSSADLLSTTWDARFSNWQRNSAELDTHAGQPLVDGTPYWAVIVIEYPDGSIGEPSMPIGPATPTDEVPTPPSWAAAGPLPEEMGGDDGDLFVEWTQCTELDADVTRIWTSPIPITNALGLMDSIDLANEAGNNTSISLQEGRPYWVALTCVDESGQHDPANATVIGPVVPTGGINDFTPPLPVEDIDAWDTPDDEGGQINVSWTPNEEEDCAWYTVFATPATSEAPPTWADDAEIASIVANCSTNGVVISEIAGQPLIDQQPYWITVVASDKWGNVDHFNITWVSTFSVQNNIGIVPPPRVEDLFAWDHPDDIGTAIDVQWTPTNVTDFAYYIVWASEHPLGDVIFKWNECKDDPSACGLMRITQQSQSFDEPMFVKMESAMYGESLESSVSSQIIPNQPIWVTVTIHDVKGNAFLTGLTDHMVMVTPIDNSIDEIAPDRLDEPEVTDRPDDNGNGLLVWYDYSDASDIAHYDIYVHDFPFTDVSTLTPSVQVLRDSPQPVVVEQLSNGSEIVPSKMLWVAVVPVDTAGNAWNDQLNVATAMAIDNGLEDALYLPEIEGLNATWNDAGTDIIVIWDSSTDLQVKGYLVHFSDQPYVDNRFPVTLATDQLIQNPELILNATTFDLRNDQPWYISVVVSDGETNRFGVTPVEVTAWISTQVDGEGDGDSTEEGSVAWWENLSVLEIALILILTSMILILALVLIVRLRKPRYDPLDHATPNWELQIEDWSDSSPGPPSETDINFEDELLPAAARIESSNASPKSETGTNFAPREPAPSTDLDEIAEGLLNETKPKSKEVDTSFLDDLL